MYKFFIKIMLFSGCVLIGLASIIFMADGSADAFYLKFTTSQKRSLIIGSSRAAQGLQPSEINTVLKVDDIYNYAFTIVHTPFGKAYYESIKRKLDTVVKDGLFIIELSPWALATQKVLDDGALKLRETNTFIDKTEWVNTNPNFEYIIESYQEQYIKLITNKYRKGDYQTFFVNADGWLEVTIVSDMFSQDYRVNNKLKTYTGYLKKYNKGLSNYRLDYLKKTIQLLQNHGKVLLVRMPIDNRMLELENQLSEGFDSIIIELSEDVNSSYINGTAYNSDYKTTDANHLTIASGKKFSRFIADSIIKLRYNNKL